MTVDLTAKQRRQLRVERLKQIRGLKAASLAAQSGATSSSASSASANTRRKRSSNGDAAAQGENANSKADLRKIRNRESAELSRQRRINEIGDLKTQVGKLERQNWLLQKRVMQLTTLLTRQIKSTSRRCLHSDDDDLSSDYSAEEESTVYNTHNNAFRTFEPAVFKL
jgi:hypothetical protein